MIELGEGVLDAAYLTRNNVEGSSSRSVFTGQQTLEPSTSTDRDRLVADLTLSWNLLDFGVSYFNARQQADRILVVSAPGRLPHANRRGARPGTGSA